MRAKPHKISDELTIYTRLLEKEDREAFLKAFSKLSDKTKQFRFLTSYPNLSEKEVDYLLQTDKKNHVALCAYHTKNGEDIGIGVTRYIRSLKNPTIAEVAITIVDEFQGMGIGKLLIQEVMDYAIKDGIKKFIANAYYFNNMILNIISKYPYEITSSNDGILSIEIDLTNGKRD